MKLRPSGRREIAEAVVVAALSALVSGLVTWGVDVVREAVNRAQQNREKEKAAAEECVPDDTPRPQMPPNDGEESR